MQVIQWVLLDTCRSLVLLVPFAMHSFPGQEWGCLYKLFGVVSWLLQVLPLSRACFPQLWNLRNILSWLAQQALLDAQLP